jgi:hypothetical protein
MMNINSYKEEISRAFFYTLATGCGFTVEFPRVDNDSVDCQVRYNGKLHSSSILYSPHIDVQLKATSAPNVDGSELVYTLKKKNYNDLRERSHIPKILVVFVMRHPHSRVNVRSGITSIYGDAYWAFFEGAVALPVGQENKNVRIPLANRFTRDVLFKMMLNSSRDVEVGHGL